ncbi:MAG TPA: PKD domain-containing protein [Dehalococcoidia bacterium]|nr:PKD domain-containing protein [Dehalococcoidia bacterium]
MLLTQQELGAAYGDFTLNSAASGYVTSNFGIGVGCASSETPGAGPIESYGSQFESDENLAAETGTFIVVEAVEHYPDTHAARQAREAFLESPADHVTLAGCPDIDVVEEEDFEPDEPDDEAGGAEEAIETDSGLEFTVTAVGFVRGKLVGKVVIAHFDRPRQRMEAAAIAGMLAARIDAVLAGSDPETPRGSVTPTASGLTPGPSGSPRMTGSPGPSGSTSPTATARPGTPRITSLGCAPTMVKQDETIICTPAISGSATTRAWSASGGSPSSGSGATFETSFASTGQKVITLQTCGGGACTAAQQSITVEEGAGPVTAPIVGSLGCSPTTLAVGASVTCGPSVSGTVTSWTWTAEGGSPASGSGPDFATSFGSPGGKQIALRACNEDACVNSSQTITVNAGGKYVVTVTSGEVSEGETVTVTVSVQTPVSGLGSYDIDIAYDPQVLAPQSCADHFGGTCDIFAFANTVSTSGSAGSSGNLTVATITFGAAGFSCCVSSLTPFAFSLQDANGKAVTNIQYVGGSITVVP